MMNKLLATGIVLVLVGIALLSVGSPSGSNASAGGFILLGPFPIVFGTGSNGTQLAFVSVVAGVIMFVLLAMWTWRVSNVSDSEK